MIYFFQIHTGRIIAMEGPSFLEKPDIQKLEWLFGSRQQIAETRVNGFFVGPRKEMITPWSTNAVEITQNMGIERISRIEEFFPVGSKIAEYDPMLQAMYDGLDQEVFTIDRTPEPIREVEDIEAYNLQEGLALNPDEVDYLNRVSERIGRRLTDSEVFGFSQVNSEHCRHKIFNGTFIIDGEEKESSLFQLIKKTTHIHPNRIVSAYKDNCSFADGPLVEQFAPEQQDRSDYFRVKDIRTVLSLKAETHNFPTTVEPFNGASTGTGGEIRDRIAGGRGAIPMAGTAVYMTSYPRSDDGRSRGEAVSPRPGDGRSREETGSPQPGAGRSWEEAVSPRPWLYQTPEEILIKASNGASDFGNKFGQPLICGSLLTFEHAEDGTTYGYDKVIMMAGGIGFGKKEDSEKGIPEKGDVVVLLGGDNYRIGMGGGAVSSVDTGRYENGIELNAVQRANPEMQKRVYNALRALAESDHNTIISIHDHGAGGHLNCLSELVEATGGVIYLNRLPVGDPTLSAREIIGNESQERMGLVMKKEDAEELIRIARRERAPIYIIGEVTDDHRFVFVDEHTGKRPMDMELTDMFGKPPRTVMEDRTHEFSFREPEYDLAALPAYLEGMLQLEAVACKDWLTNKVDRSVTGRVALQQCAGPLQLPLNNLGAVALDYRGMAGYATAIGHAPVAGMIDPGAGSVLAIAEALTNLVWAPLPDGIRSVSLSANWMWPCRNPGEDARLYAAAKAASDFAIALGINIPTGKDSLSMTQKYRDGVVIAPGTVIISAAAEVTDIRKIVQPVLVPDPESRILYVDLSGNPSPGADDDPVSGGGFPLGGSAFFQYMNTIGGAAPGVNDPAYFVRAFNLIQLLIADKKILAGHDVSAGGVITTLMEMCFATDSGGLEVDISSMPGETIAVLFSEKPAVVIQVNNVHEITGILEKEGIYHHVIGRPVEERETGRPVEERETRRPVKEREILLETREQVFHLPVDHYRDAWFRSSYLLDRKQTGEELALERYRNYKKHALKFDLKGFTGTFASLDIDPGRREPSGIRAAIIREKGVNGDREMAYALYLAGFDVKDVHMTDLISGRETLEEVQMIVFVGGFSNSDVLGSAKGWAGGFRYNDRARQALERFYSRPDTLSLGICNGCQLMVELDLIIKQYERKPQMLHNRSGKFESSYLSVTIPKNNSVMFRSLEGMALGIWVAHGEGRFSLPAPADDYHVVTRYSHSTFPANPNGSENDVAAICSTDGRHLAMMPHLERSYLPWQCGWYPTDRREDDATPWLQAFVDARNWLEEKAR